MAWTAKFKSAVNAEKGLYRVVITFTDGAKGFDKEFLTDTANLEFIKRMARIELRKLNNAVLDVSLVAGDVIDTTEPVAPPTPPPNAALLWSKAFNELSARVKLKDLGVLTGAGNDTRIATLQTQLKNNLKPEYIEFIR